MGTVFGYAIGGRIRLLQCPKIARCWFGKPFGYPIGVSLRIRREKGHVSRVDALVAHGCSLLLVLWQSHVFIGKTRLGLHRLVTD
jgi:hypothetical protein